MEQINVINNSTDQNNLQVVIFQADAEASELIATAMQIVSVPAGQTVSVSLPDDAGVCFVALSPDVAAGQIIYTEDLAAQAVAIQSGQTAYITGNADEVYAINVKND